MMDSPRKPVSLDYAPPKRRLPWKLFLIVTGTHLFLAFFTIVDWGDGNPLAWLSPILMFPFHVAAEYGLLMEVEPWLIVLLLFPLNSLFYGTAITAGVLMIRRFMR